MTRRRTRRGRWCGARWCIAAGLAFAAAPVRAQVVVVGEAEDNAQRSALLRAAEQADADGNAREAYDLALRAEQLRPSPSVALFLARQARAAQRVHRALAHVDDCLRQLARDASVRRAAEIAAQCTAMSHELRATVGFVRVRAPATGEVRVFVNDEALLLQEHGLEVAVLPGRARVLWVVDGRRRTRVVNVDRGASVALGWDDFRDVAATQADDALLGADGDAPRRRAPEAAAGPGVGPWVLVGVGAAGVVAASVLFGLRNDALSGCEVQGDTAVCDADRLDYARMAPAFAYGGDAALVAGLGLAAGGVLWWALARPRASASARWAPTARGFEVRF